MVRSTEVWADERLDKVDDESAVRAPIDGLLPEDVRRSWSYPAKDILSYCMNSSCRYVYHEHTSAASTACPKCAAYVMHEEARDLALRVLNIPWNNGKP